MPTLRSKEGVEYFLNIFFRYTLAIIAIFQVDMAVFQGGGDIDSSFLTGLIGMSE